ncbi:folate-sensitive fragile site protein Fra10Ac1-domain-containing protein [Spinellus fusiger]|nr:folate-sensitive fragile site protein Fra10Ac1-domain-containing protein [Spinellus fusiger]
MLKVSHKQKASDKPKSVFRKDLRGVDAYTRHKKLIRDYTLFYNRQITTKKQDYKTEVDIIRENHRFIHNEDKPQQDAPWEQRLAKKYYDTLFKEYAIGELKYYKEAKIALRWRTEHEVITGKGQFVCASTRCDGTHGLESWEVNFRYVEEGESKNELVKIRLCPGCSDKLNYKTQKKLAKRKKDEEKEKKKTHKRLKRDASGGSPERDDREEERGEEREEAAAEEPSVWQRPMESKEDKSKEEEFEDYFADLLQ